MILLGCFDVLRFTTYFIFEKCYQYLFFINLDSREKDKFGNCPEVDIFF